MEFITVKEAAQKFNLTERRVQQLCESNRIEGRGRFSGIWLIPNSAVKPNDERINSTSVSDDYLTLNKLCSELSISTATGRNWIKLGKITPSITENSKYYFTKEYLLTLRNELKSGKNTALKSRRNKKFVSGITLYKSYVSDTSKNLPLVEKLVDLTFEKDINLNTDTIQFLVANCALCLFANKQNQIVSKNENLLSLFLKGKVSIGKYDKLIVDLIHNKEEALLFSKEYSDMLKADFIYEENEDILGLTYISCKNIGNRKATGSYYTPTKIVKRLIEKLSIQKHQKILDPCCGTGNFLLQLPLDITFDSIFGNDIDPISVKITRLNMALKYDAPIDKLYNHITCSNFLTDYIHIGTFDFVIGNPPWGFEFSDDEKNKLKNKFNSAIGKNIESYDLFLEQSLNTLSINGHVALVLPEAILNVKAHTEIRKCILNNSLIKKIDFLGNAFEGVQCPCIILDLERSNASFSTIGMNITNKSNSFTINTEREVTADNFSFGTTDEEYAVLNKIKNVYNCSYLQGNADFALGIVTGNNKEYISSEKSNDNEIVLKGSDISKYHINNSSNYITFQPENFQQTAPTEFYRAKEKLFYRFICNQLVFAYDDKQTLSLNSCNIVIPRIPNISIKYVLAVLNSRIAQFIFKKEFNSVKILRAHIESIPIPLVDQNTQDEVIKLANKLIDNVELKEAQKLYEEIDILISNIFCLDATDMTIIKKAVDDENKFLA